MTCAQGLLRLLWGGPEVGVLRDCLQLLIMLYNTLAHLVRHQYVIDARFLHKRFARVISALCQDNNKILKFMC